MNEKDVTDLVTALYDRWYTSLVRYALRTTENYEIAEDIAQETFIELYQALGAGKNIEHPKAWTLCVLRRAVSRQMRGRTHLEQLEEGQMAGEISSDVPGFRELDDIRTLLSVLSPREEEVLLLRVEAMKYKEIADQLGISMNSVNTLLARALRKLQEAMMQRMTKERVKKHAVQQTIRAS